MLAKVADAFLLLALTVIIHGAGLTIVLRRLPLWKTADDAGFISRTWLLIQLASCPITIHMVEIAMWGYFSGGRNACRILNRRSTSRSSLTPLWNTAISCSRKLMCGWSTGFFFIVASKLYGSRLGPRQN